MKLLPPILLLLANVLTLQASKEEQPVYELTIVDAAKFADNFWKTPAGQAFWNTPEGKAIIKTMEEYRDRKLGIITQ